METFAGSDPTSAYCWERGLALSMQTNKALCTSDLAGKSGMLIPARLQLSQSTAYEVGARHTEMDVEELCRLI